MILCLRSRSFVSLTSSPHTRAQLSSTMSLNLHESDLNLSIPSAIFTRQIAMFLLRERCPWSFFVVLSRSSNYITMWEFLFFCRPCMDVCAERKIREREMWFLSFLSVSGSCGLLFCRSWRVQQGSETLDLIFDASSSPPLGVIYVVARQIL